MKFRYLTAALCLLVISSVIYKPVYSTTYYVSPSGNNTDGSTPTNAFQTLQQAADIVQAGDTVLVMNGTYTSSYYGSDVVIIGAQGTASAWIVFKNYPGDKPVIQLSSNWQGITLDGAAYVIIDGFTVIGNNDQITLAYAQSQKMNINNPATSGNGISIKPQYNNPSNRPKHIVIKNCTVQKCGGGGIGSGQADYITIENNVVSACGWYAPYDASGISLYQNWNSDGEITTKNYIMNNTCYDNWNYIPNFTTASITDGNGIIIDDSRNTQNNSTLGPYKSTTYIANNVVYGNGGRGIHVYSSDNVIAVNNTCYQNCQSPSVTSSELSANTCGNVTFLNNIAVPSGNLAPMSQYNATQVQANYNLYGANASLASPQGANNLTGNPLFVNASSNPGVADFHLLQGSPAIDAGTKTDAPATDHDGKTRGATDSIDIGAYQMSSTAQAVDSPSAAGLSNLTITDNTTSNELSWKYGPNPTLDSFQVQRSSDGVNFIDIDEINHNTDSSVSYQFRDLSPFDGENYYRLEIISKGNLITYSTVITAKNKPPDAVKSSLPLAPAPGLSDWIIADNTSNNDLSWKYGPNPTLDSFEVQRSSDGVNFIDIDEINHNTDTSVSYQFRDLSPINGENYYRLEIISNGKLITYSSVATARNEIAATIRQGPDSSSAITSATSLFPNPVHVDMLLKTTYQPGTECFYEIFNSLGIRVSKANIVSSDTVIDASHWTGGFYVMQIRKGSSGPEVLEFIKQ